MKLEGGFNECADIAHIVKGVDFAPEVTVPKALVPLKMQVLGMVRSDRRKAMEAGESPYWTTKGIK